MHCGECMRPFPTPLINIGLLRANNILDGAENIAG
jgi:hypothetical protein